MLAPGGRAQPCLLRDVVRWVDSFLHDRSAAIALPGYTQPSTPTAGSLPQGSPVSPILFMLFMQPMMASAPPHRRSLARCGYADDVLLTARSPSLLVNTQALTADL